MSAPSNLDLLRERYEKLAARGPQTFHKLVGGVCDGKNGELGLLIEYRQPEWERTQEVDKRWESSSDPKAPVYAAAEVLATCCVDIWLRDEENGEEVEGVGGRWVPGLGLGEGPVNFAKAAKSLGLADGSDGIAAVGAVLVDDWEITHHQFIVAQWQPAPPEVGDEFVGESQAAPAS